MSGRDAGPSEWSSRALTRRLADYLVNAYTDGRGYDPTDLDDVEVTLRDGFDIVLGEMHEAQRDRSDGGGSEDSTTASECPATAEPPSAPVTASGEAEFIAWCRNHADALADLADTVKAIPRHYPYGGPEVEDVTGKCLVCGTSWPCPTERAHRALDALEATDG